MSQLPKIGDSVIAYGYTATVVSVDPIDGMPGKFKVEVAESGEQAEAVHKARTEFLALREQQAALNRNELSLDAYQEQHAKLHGQMAELSAVASRAIFRMGLRADLLSWWEEKQCWVSDGRILSDAQAEEWLGEKGKQVPAKQQRKVYLALTSKG